MADVTALTSAVYQDGQCEKTALFSLKNVSAADTVDVGSWFNVVKRAGVVSATGTTIAAVTTIANNPKGVPTLLTIPAGPANDGLWLIVVGVAT